MNNWVALCAVFASLACQSRCEELQTTKVFILPILPTMFNWTVEPGDHFVYEASLLNAPDLPKWIQYIYSSRLRTGYLYGAPPNTQSNVEIEIVGLNKRTYETSRRVVHLNIDTKPNPATREVHLKVDNLNVDDLFDTFRAGQLLDVFKHKLWKDSFADLYITMLASAVTLGARLPLRPNEGEGVVVRLGSMAPFSNTLLELQEEVRPLTKLSPFCPRDFKRTTVERLFREEGFVLDWCNFKLIDKTLEGSESSGETRDGPARPELDSEPVWSRPSREEVPQRSYAGELAFTILVPALIMAVLVIVLSFILCLQREGERDESDEFFDQLFDSVAKRSKDGGEPPMNVVQFGTNPRATTTLRSLTANREMTPEVNGSAVSHTASPPAARSELNGVSRPTPPPYTGTGTARSTRVEL